MAKHRSDGLTELEERYAGYQVYDQHYEEIGKVDDLFVDEDDRPEYIGVKMGFLGTRSTLIPLEVATVHEERGIIEVAADKDKVKDGPTFDDDKEITPEYEERVRSHYGLGGLRGTTPRDAYYSSAGEGYAREQRPGMTMGDVDRERGGFREHRASPGHEGATKRGSDLAGENELGVQRTEEELRAGTRERESGGVSVRKRVRTDREQIRVPKSREEVHVERVPVEGREAPGAEIGDDELWMPVTEEEVVVEKRPVAKEEIRVRKDVAQEEEIVEEDVRKEEVHIDDRTSRRGDLGGAAEVDRRTRRRNG